ncbi:flavin oxidoreductase, partial [archaeon]|nr:flavin oxidoreductase [archaeon]
MLKIDRESIDSMDKRYRTQLINSLWGVRPAVLVSTIDKKGNSNLAIFNSLMHIGAHPPLVGLIFRPDSVDRHTL